MADFWDHPGDFSLGGFQPAPTYTGPTGAASAGMGVDTAPPMQLPDWLKNAPRINDPQMPFQPNDPRLSPLPQPWQQGPNYPSVGLPSLGPAADMGPNGPTFTNGQGQSTDQFGNLTPQQMQQIGSAFRGTAQRFQGRTPLSGFSPSNAQQIGQGMGQAVSGMGGTPLANGIGQPMNPSQQSGMVLMQSPDGMHMQQVPQAHVDHYTGLGATQVTGPQLTGSSYGGSF